MNRSVEALNCFFMPLLPFVLPLLIFFFFFILSLSRFSSLFAFARRAVGVYVFSESPDLSRLATPQMFEVLPGTMLPSNP